VYQDVVEWDVLNEDNSPEEFARRTVAEEGEPSLPDHTEEV
jgi:hypothetical protein